MSDLWLPAPPLVDDVIRLRPWVEADLVAAYRANQHALVPPFARAPTARTDDDVHSLLDRLERARLAGDALALVVADVRTDELLGAISLLRFEWAERRGEVGYRLAPWARGRGLATRAVRLLAGWALTQLAIARLALHTDGDNHASQRVAERSGFTREGLLRSFAQRDGRRHDVVVFSLLPSDLGS